MRASFSALLTSLAQLQRGKSLCLSSLRISRSACITVHFSEQLALKGAEWDRIVHNWRGHCAVGRYKSAKSSRKVNAMSLTRVAVVIDMQAFVYGGSFGVLAVI